MRGLIEFSIPLSGLVDGEHRFEFEVDKDFFSHFPDSPVADGSLQVEVSMYKRPDLLVFDFDISGTVSTECDRCLTGIQLPVSGSHQLIAKISDFGTSEDIDVIFLPTSTTDFDLSPYVYEYVVLTIPMMKIYDCEDEAPQPCDEAMLDKLDEAESLPEPEEEEVNPIWEELKKKLTNNK